MKKQSLPQDDSHLANFTREVLYVKNEEGKYETDLSKGWEVKKKALDHAWEAIEERVLEAQQKVQRGEASPLLYYFEKMLMDYKVLAGYTGFYRWQIKRHMKPHVFSKLSQNKLGRYAKSFGITVDELKNPDFLGRV